MLRRIIAAAPRGWKATPRKASGMERDDDQRVEDDRRQDGAAWRLSGFGGDSHDDLVGQHPRAAGHRVFVVGWGAARQRQPTHAWGYDLPGETGPGRSPRKMADLGWGRKVNSASLGPAEGSLSPCVQNKTGLFGVN